MERKGPDSQVRKKLLEMGVLTPEKTEEIKSSLQNEIAAAERFAKRALIPTLLS